ncbi:hypothetical protein GGI43DRAFT_378662 [Trichoderma evansii]
MAIINHNDHTAHLIDLGAAVSCDSKPPLRASGCAAMETVLTLPLSKIALIQESISNSVVLVMTSQSVQQRSAHDAMVNPSPALLAAKGKKFASGSTRIKQGGY